MSETHLEDLKFRLMTINLLKTTKRMFTYRELSAKTGLPVTVLSRYVKGHVLPSSSRARKIWKTLERLGGLEQELRDRSASAHPAERKSHRFLAFGITAVRPAPPRRVSGNPRYHGPHARGHLPGRRAEISSVRLLLLANRFERHHFTVKEVAYDRADDHYACE